MVREYASRKKETMTGMIKEWIYKLVSHFAQYDKHLNTTGELFPFGCIINNNMIE